MKIKYPTLSVESFYLPVCNSIENMDRRVDDTRRAVNIIPIVVFQPH